MVVSMGALQRQAGTLLCGSILGAGLVLPASFWAFPLTVLNFEGNGSFKLCRWRLL